MGLKESSDSDQSQNSDSFNSSSSSSSSKSYSSLYSQASLPSVQSLTQPENPSTTTTTTTYHHRATTTIKGHSSYVFCLSLAGKHIYSGSSDGEIRIYSRDSSNGENDVVARIGSAVKSIVILGDKLFSAHQDHRIRVWKIDNNTNNQKYKCIATLPTLNDRCMTLFCAKNRYVEVRRNKKCTWVHHVDTISALALSKDGSLLYSVSWDRTFKIWRTSDFKCLESVMNAHDDAINAVAISNDGYVYTGSADKKIKIWRKKEGENNKHTLVDTLEKHKSAVNALALSSDGSILYSGACDRSIIVWEKDISGAGAGAGKMVVAGALRGHSKAILCLSVVADLVCSGSADKTVRMWKRGLGKSYTCLGVFEGHKGPVKCLTVTLDGKNSKKDECGGSGNSYVVYSGGLDCDIKVWKFWVPYLLY